MTLDKAQFIMRDRTYFGIMMLRDGGLRRGPFRRDLRVSDDHSSGASDYRLERGITRVSGMFAMIQKDQVYMFADTTVNINPTAEELAEIAILRARSGAAVQYRAAYRDAVVLELWFGASIRNRSRWRKRPAIVKKKAPDLMVDGEMQADTAVMPEFVKRYFPFSHAQGSGQRVHVPGSGFGEYRLQAGCSESAAWTAVGPILMGLSNRCMCCIRTLDVDEIVDMAAIAVVDAQR